MLLLAIVLVARVASAQAPPVLVVEAPPSLAAAEARLAPVDTRALAGIVRLVGLDEPGPPIRVVLAEDRGPWAAHVTSWTAGYAVGRESLVVLFPSRSPVYPDDSLEDVLRHEIAHVLIDRAAGYQPVPRWFHEGLAVAAERAWGLRDRTRVLSSVILGSRLDLTAVDRLFLADQGSQERAYVLAAAHVRDLMDEHGASTPAAILRGVAAGLPFDTAVVRATGGTIRDLEDLFWRRQRTWTVWVPLVTSSTTIWLVVMGVAALAVRRRRRRAEEIRRRWEEEEEARAAAVWPGEEEERGAVAWPLDTDGEERDPTVH